MKHTEFLCFYVSTEFEKKRKERHLWEDHTNIFFPLHVVFLPFFRRALGADRCHSSCFIVFFFSILFQLSLWILVRFLGVYAHCLCLFDFLLLIFFSLPPVCLLLSLNSFWVKEHRPLLANQKWDWFNRANIIDTLYHSVCTFILLLTMAYTCSDSVVKAQRSLQKRCRCVAVCVCVYVFWRYHHPMHIHVSKTICEQTDTEIPKNVRSNK